MVDKLEGVFTLAGPSGGTGRTTLALTLGALLALRGEDVLLIDLDPRGSLSCLAGLEAPTGEHGILQALAASEEPFACIRETGYERLSILGSDLTHVAEQLQIELALADWRALPRVLKPLRGRYKTILIDTPPGLGRPTRAAIQASDEVLVPLVAEPLAVRTLPTVLQAILDARIESKTPRLAGIFLNRVDTAAPLFRQIVEELNARFQPLLLDTAIPWDPWFIEAAARAMPLPFLYPDTRGIAAATSLLNELTARLNGLGGQPL